MSEPNYLLPAPYTCATCIHFKPEIIYSHRGVPYAMWYGLCVILP